MFKNFVFSLFVTLSVVTYSSVGYAAGGTITGLKMPGQANSFDLILPERTVKSLDGSYAVAEQFIRSTGLHKSLSLLLLDSVKNDELVENAISQFGFPLVKNTVVSNIKDTTNHYRQDWVSLLASIYSEQFNSNTLRSILEDGENSPYYSEFVALQGKMDTAKILSDSNIFKEARSDLIKTLKKNFRS
ncbi:MAG: hypothetical protein KDF58_12925 [Alphaproteobacteria bacterium]|nr:hypothetical protein [Alphaproteobacteria bacterium]HPF47621.1 hypothetical protein [Emcibacteraceae bacterium]